MAENSLPKIVSARDAFDKGKTRYFTGKPCKKGHVAERTISNGTCVTCLAARRRALREKTYAKVKAWRKANPEKRKEQDRRYARKHPETHARAAEKYRASHVEEIRAKDREFKRNMRATNPETRRAIAVRFRARREEKLVKLAGRARPEVCDVCGEFSFRIVFDHCHASGSFRGWLCDRCNRVLGTVNDSPQLLAALADYLKGTNGKINDKTKKQPA